MKSNHSCQTHNVYHLFSLFHLLIKSLFSVLRSFTRVQYGGPLARGSWGFLKHIAAPVMWEPTGESGYWPTAVSARVKAAGMPTHGLHDEFRSYPGLFQPRHPRHLPSTTLGLPRISQSYSHRRQLKRSLRQHGCVTAEIQAPET